MTSPPDQGSHLRSIWEQHGSWAIGIGILLIVLGWLTWRDVHPDVGLLVYVAILAGLHRWLDTTKRLTPMAREYLIFLVMGLGLLGVLWMMSSFNNRYMAGVFLTILIYALFALGLNLQFGYTGIINFGHVAFMGIGGYTVAIITLNYIDHAAVLERPGFWSVFAVVGSAVFFFLVVGLLVTLLSEHLLRTQTGPTNKRRRTELTAGVTAGAAAALVFVVVVPFPLTPMWATAYFLGGATIIGMLLAAIAGLLLGLPTLRLRLDYLAIVTIGGAEILRRVFLNESWLTQGPLGIRARQGERPFDAAVTEWQWPGHLAGILDVPIYSLLLIMMLLGIVMLVFASYQMLSRYPYGRVLRAVREDEDLATALGKNVFSYKLQVLAIGGAVAALSGAFLLWQGQFVEPNEFHPLITFYAWIIVVVGGAGNNKGTLVGAVVLWTLFEATRFLDLAGSLGLTSTQIGALRVALIGFLLILLMLFKPEGILGKREELVLGD